MSRDHVEIVRRLQPATGDDIAPWFRDEAAWAGIAASLRDVMAPDLVAEVVLSVERSTHRGLEGLRQAWLEWLAPWETYRAGIEDVRDMGAHVLVLAHDRGRRRGMDIEVANPDGAALYTFREGRIVRIGFYASRRDALADLRDAGALSRRPPGG